MLTVQMIVIYNRLNITVRAFITVCIKPCIFHKKCHWNRILVTHTVCQCFLLIQTEIIPYQTTSFFFSRFSTGTNKFFVLITNMCNYQYRTQDSSQLQWWPVSTIVKNIKRIKCEWISFDMMYNLHCNIRW